MLAIAVISNLGMLEVFKYADMFLQIVNQISHWNLPMTNLQLPIGISFFSQLIAGPIVKYHEIQEQIYTRKHCIEDVAIG